MQTFLPFSDFAGTAAILDARRLGKQRVEVLQILRALTFDDYGWRTHPAVTMWSGHTSALVTYGVAVTRQWLHDGFTDTVMPKLLEFIAPEPVRSQAALAEAGCLPPWLGWEPLHRSHQAALVRKDADHYGPVFPDVDPGLPYVWPRSVPPERDAAPVTAWVVRASVEEAGAMRRRSFVGVRPAAGENATSPEGPGTRYTKRRRQLRTFRRDIRDGDPVVVPSGDWLLVGQVLGDYEWWPGAPLGLHHIRRVRWLKEMHRSRLIRPVHLQDPRVVFGLRNEPAVATDA